MPRGGFIKAWEQHLWAEKAALGWQGVVYFILLCVKEVRDSLQGSGQQGFQDFEWLAVVRKMLFTTV